MTILKNRNRHSVMFSRGLLMTLLVCACHSDPYDDPIPVVPFPDMLINLNLPEYNSLAIDGGTKQVSSIGVRGVILYRKNSATYLAFEVNCSYHPNEASANVGVHTSALYMSCSGCGSNFSFSDGVPTGGVAWRPLRKYRTELNGFNLTVTDEIAN